MLRPLTLLTICFTLPGCAFGTREVNLAYEAKATAPRDSRGAIAVVPFADARPPEQAVGSQVGQVSDRYGTPAAAVNAAQAPVPWVSDSLARGLAARGYRVERPAQPAQSSAVPTLSGTVKQVWVAGYVPLEARVIADVVVTQAGRTTFSTECSGADTIRPFTGSAKEFQTVLNGAMDRFVSSCVAQLAPYLTTQP